MNSIEIKLTADNVPSYIFLIDGVTYPQKQFATEKEALESAYKKVEELKIKKKSKIV